MGTSGASPLLHTVVYVRMCVLATAFQGQSCWVGGGAALKLLPDDVGVMVSTGSRAADPQGGRDLFLSVGVSLRLLAQVQRKSLDESVGAKPMSASSISWAHPHTAGKKLLAAVSTERAGQAQRRPTQKGRLLIDGKPRGVAYFF